MSKLSVTMWLTFSVYCKICHPIEDRSLFDATDDLSKSRILAFVLAHLLVGAEDVNVFIFIESELFHPSEPRPPPDWYTEPLWHSRRQTS